MTVQLLSLSVIQKPLLVTTRVEVFMPAPYTTIQSTITVTDVNNFLVFNASAVVLTVTFPDQTTTVLTMAGGDVINLNNGQYLAKYSTKGPGPTRELWQVTAADNVTTVTYQFELVTGY